MNVRVIWSVSRTSILYSFLGKTVDMSLLQMVNPFDVFLRTVCARPRDDDPTELGQNGHTLYFCFFTDLSFAH